MATQKKATEQARFENIAKTVGKKYGYDRVSVELSTYADFKMRWTRSYHWIDFQVSDYMIGAPDEVVEDIFECVFSRIEGTMREYSSATTDYLTANKFAQTHRATYLKRHKAESEMFKEFHGAHVHFAKNVMDVSRIGFASTLMNTIILNPYLKEFDDEVIENAIAHEYNTIQEGLSMFGKDGEQPVEYDIKALRGFRL